MLKHARISLILCSMCYGSVLNAEDKPAPALTEDAREDLNDYREEIAEILAEAKEDLAEEKEELLEDLEKELRKSTRRGELEAATAIQKRLEELRLEQQKAESADLFGVAKKKPEPKYEVTIVRSFAAGRNGMKDITKELQAVVDKGDLTFVPAEALGDAVDGPVRRILLEYKINGEQKRTASAWSSELNLKPED